MANAKIDIKIGAIEFVGEGEEKWVSAQLDKILGKAGTLLKAAPSQPSTQTGGSRGSQSGEGAEAQVSLARFLKDHNVGAKQVDRFLATAIWLARRGKARIQTGDVSSALRQSNIGKLNNSADCLNQNVRKGYCEKDGKEFFVTQDGLEQYT